MKFSPEIGQEIGIEEGLFILPIDFPQFLGFMKCDLDPRCLQ